MYVYSNEDEFFKTNFGLFVHFWSQFLCGLSIEESAPLTGIVAIKRAIDVFDQKEIPFLKFLAQVLEVKTWQISKLYKTAQT